MKNITSILLASALVALAITTNAQTATNNPLKTATIAVQHHDIAVKVSMSKPIPPKAERNYDGLPTAAITGYFVTICLADRYELVSTECHWDGVSEKNRYAFTLHYRLRDANNASLMTYSINLACFDAIFIGKGPNAPAEVTKKFGIIPEDGVVSFESISIEKIVAGDNPGNYYARQTP